MTPITRSRRGRGLNTAPAAPSGRAGQGGGALYRQAAGALVRHVVVVQRHGFGAAADGAAHVVQELRELGANLQPQRFAGLRGRRWRERLHALLDERLRGADGKLALTFEIIYGHAFKPLPRPRVGGESAVSLSDMRSLLQADQRRRG